MRNPYRETWHPSSSFAWVMSFVAAAVIVSNGADARAQTSQLWGKSGEKWSSESRLPDFSFEGYRRGEEPYRIPAERISVASFAREATVGPARQLPSSRPLQPANLYQAMLGKRLERGDAVK